MTAAMLYDTYEIVAEAIIDILSILHSNMAIYYIMLHNAL
jgi:hypothetical protein